jgi:hypothetical protein
MKKTLLATIACMMIAATACFGAITMTFNDNSGAATAGTYLTTDTFSFDVFLTTDFTAQGVSYWLETQTLNGFTAALTITNITYVNFTGPTDNGFPKAFTSATGADSGFLADDDTVINPQTGTIDEGDLGATSPSHAPGTFQIATIFFSISGATPGTYLLQSTTASPKVSEATGTDFSDNPFGTAVYTITIVPEPSTFALLGLAATGLGVAAYRRRRAA